MQGFFKTFICKLHFLSLYEDIFPQEVHKWHPILSDFPQNMVCPSECAPQLMSQQIPRFHFSLTQKIPDAGPAVHA